MTFAKQPPITMSDILNVMLLGHALISITLETPFIDVKSVQVRVSLSNDHTARPVLDDNLHDISTNAHNIINQFLDVTRSGIGNIEELSTDEWRNNISTAINHLIVISKIYSDLAAEADFVHGVHLGFGTKPIKERIRSITPQTPPSEQVEIGKSFFKGTNIELAERVFDECGRISGEAIEAVIEKSEREFELEPFVINTIQ